MSCISKTRSYTANFAGDTELLSEIFNEVTSGIIVLDKNGFVVKANASAINLLNLELQNRRWIDIVKEIFAPKADDGNEVSLRNGKKVLVSTKPLSVGQLVVLTDVTQTRVLQERVSHMERLSSLGKMAASLAHQIRTPLSAAILYAANLGNKFISESARDNFSKKLMARLQDLESQVRDILIFARSGEKIVERVEIVDLVNSIKNGAEATLVRNGVVLETQMDEPPIEIIANTNALSSAINNLVNNAVEAGAKKIILNVRKIESNVVIKVADNGKGMSQTQINKVFEPFFTTKSNGTGLGLAVVKSVINSHQGTVQITSFENKGTCFTITLPLAKPQEETVTLKAA